jgi:hypothetical protein
MPSRPGACPFCQGSGLCHRCDGMGFIRARRVKPHPCHECDGTGKCELCGGSGLSGHGKPGKGKKEDEGR